ncbi:MAG: tetratricopeptide repeat protein [Pseudomonadota bacterium]
MTAQQLRPLLLSAVLATGLSTAAYGVDAEAPDLPEAEPVPGLIGAYVAGMAAGQRGDADTAAALLLGLSERVSPQVAVLGPALRAAVSAGLIEEAIPVARVLLDLDPRASEAAILLLLADAAREGDWEAAKALLALLPGRDLSGTRRDLLRAWVTLPLEGADAALEILAPLEERRGLKTLALVHKALILDIAGDPAAADAYRAALGESEVPSGRSLLLASTAFARDGAREEALALIDAELDRGRNSATLEALRAELASGEPLPELVANASDGVSEVFLQIGAALNSENERLQVMALQEARLAAYVAPESRAAALLEAELLSRVERHDEAVSRYEGLLDDPRHGRSAALARADALAAAERLDEAEAAYRELAAAEPDDPEAMMRLGNMLRWDRRFEASAAAYNEAVARSGEPQELDWVLYYFRGIANERSGDWDAAEADFLLALELRPEQPQVLNYLGYSWVERKENLAEAKAMLERAVELRPRDGYIVDSLGWALYKLGEYEAAVEQLELAVELDPSQAVINDHLGDAYWRVGRTREAIVQWQRTLSLGEDPDIDPEEVRRKLVEGLPPVQQADLSAEQASEELPEAEPSSE